MHARKKGKASSKPPYRTDAPEWIKFNKEDIEKIIIKLARQGNSTSMIGMILRDSYGIPNVKLVLGKKITQVLKEHNIAPKYPEDLVNLIRRAERLRKHLENNKKDLHSRRGLQLIESKIHRLSKYYRRKGVLDPKWKYDPRNIAKILR